MSVHRIMDTTANRQLPHPPAAPSGAAGAAQTMHQVVSNGRIYRYVPFLWYIPPTAPGKSVVSHLFVVSLRDGGEEAKWERQPPGTNAYASLDIVQQPSRARMCGFGDKVRPDIQSSGSPPAGPCV